MFQALALAALAATNPGSQPAGPPHQGWVVLPVQEYRTLREQANPSTPEPDDPDVDATLTSVEYALRADGSTASGEVRLTIDVFAKGWVRMSVPPGLFVKAAHLDGKPTSLVESDNSDGSAILLSRTGRSVLSLDVDLPVTAGAGTETLTLPVSPAALTRASLAIPRLGVELSAAGGAVVESGEAKGEARFIAVARPGSPLALTWKRHRTEARTGLPMRLRANLTQIVGLGEEGSQASVVVALEVTQGVAPGVEIAAPEPFVVTQVVGAAVADWEAKRERLAVRFIDPIEEQTAFVVVAEARTPREGRIALPLLRVPSAEREEGALAVEVVGAGEIAIRETRGLTAADAADLGDVLAARDSPSLAAFRLKPGDGHLERALALDVVRYTPQAVVMANVEEARYRALLTEDGKTLVQARYAVRNNQRSFLKVTLPKDATLWSALVARRVVRPGITPDGALLLPLEKGRAGEEAPAFPVEIVYLQRSSHWADRGSATLPLPALDLGISRTGVEVHHPPRFRLRPQPGAFREAPFEPPSAEAFAPPRQKATPRPTISVNPIDVGANAAQLTTLVPPGRQWKADTVQQDFARKQQQEAEQAEEEAQGLVERFNREAAQGGRASGTLPVEVRVPAIGPRLYLVTELTAEGVTPSVTCGYERRKK